uniref:Alcohol dehydrogenase transcription factor myb/sant-like protein n=1 Tax=Culex tarsalis TaxID=7177 RepID=A0A1Q3FTX5_CULTA
MVQPLDLVLRQNLNFNLKLVKLVEKYPHLYKNEPKCAVTSQDTWEVIAEIMDCNVSSKQLRLHWRGLRHKYVQFLKKGSADHPERIESHLHFLKPHLKVEIYANRKANLHRERLEEDSYSPTVPKIARVESYAQETKPASSDCERWLGNGPEDPDAMFLLSIVPRMKIMTGPQRRQFKIGAVTLSGEILSSNKC